MIGNIIIGNGKKVYGMRKKSKEDRSKETERIYDNKNRLDYFFLKKPLPLNGNIMHDKCAPLKDARLRRTSVVSTKNTTLGSKNAVLAVKMLKIRKKRLTKAFSC